MYMCDNIEIKKTEILKYTRHAQCIVRATEPGKNITAYGSYKFYLTL
jgi:hypothetical protein